MLVLAMLLRPSAQAVAAAHQPDDLSGLFADAATEAWPDGKTPVGSGIVAPGDPYVLTAAHVIAGCRHVMVARDGTQRQLSLIGLDSRLDLALLEDRRSAGADQATGSALAASIVADFTEPDGTAPPSDLTLHVVGFGQPGRNADDPVQFEVRPAGVVDVAGALLLALAGRLVSGDSGSPVLRADGRTIGMIIGQLRADRSRGVAVRGPDLLRFLTYFGLAASPAQRGKQPAQGVMVQCGR